MSEYQYEFLNWKNGKKRSGKKAIKFFHAYS